MDPSRVAVLAAFVGGVLVGGVAVGAVTPSGPGEISPENPPYGVATGTGCIDEPGGWAFTTAGERGQTVVVNLTVAHAPAERVDTDLAYEGDGAYRFAVTTVPAEKSGAPDCPTGSTVEFAGTLPDDFRTVTVVYDGSVVGTVENTGNPSYRPLTPG